MGCLATIVIEKDAAGNFPDVSNALAFLRTTPSFWRFVIFSLERTGKEIADSEQSLDPVPFLGHISAALGVNIEGTWEGVQACLLCALTGSSELSPASAALCLEPLLYMFGYGRFCLRVAPYCAFVSVLFTAGPLQSQPLSRYFDLELFYREVTPLLPQLRANNYRIGVTVGAKLKRLLKKCLRGGAPVKDVYSYFVDEKKREAAEEFSRHLQCIVVHNNMDMGCVDSVRRCNCASVQAGTTRGSLAAACTACI